MNHKEAIQLKYKELDLNYEFLLILVSILCLPNIQVSPWKFSISLDFGIYFLLTAQQAHNEHVQSIATTYTDTGTQAEGNKPF